MKYLPFENITYKTQLTSEDAINRLREKIEPKKTFRMNGLFGSNNHKPYEGIKIIPWIRLFHSSDKNPPRPLRNRCGRREKLSAKLPIP